MGLALLSGLVWYVRSFTNLPTPDTQPAGAASGPSHFTVESFLQGLTAGARDQFAVNNVGVITHNGVDSLTVEYPIAATSSTIVSIPNPFGTAGLASSFSPSNATTTVRFAGCQITVNPFVGAFNYDMSTSSSAFATSAVAFVYSHAVGAAAADTMFWTDRTVASSSLTVSNSIWTTDMAKDGSDPFVLTPSQYLNFKIASGTPGTFAGGYLTGVCFATFTKP